MRTIAGVASDMGLETVIAAGGADLTELDPLPANTRALPWIPLSVLLPTCSAVVHHGGAGSMFNAFVAGIPQLVVPHVADHPSNAAAVERRGAGLVLDRARASAATVRDALRRLLGERPFARAAREVGREIADLPTPADVIVQLEKLPT
jgi:glycosyltransferase